ncbi:hypothetical protein DFH09DRAFT_1078648 [Mycena vulgaris]|nr:hypothetical protein DFH09DRAFT_1078648 [Mycena vulgaris]
MLARMKQDKTFTLGLARYGDDFAAIRDHTDNNNGDSVYHFVHTQAPVTNPFVPVRHARYMAVVFGCIAAVGDMADGAGVWVRLQRPLRATCAVKSFYAKQHRTLFTIIQDDSRDLVLIQGATDRDVLRIKEDISHIGGLGINVEFVVGMERRDTHDGHSVYRTYAMYSAHYTLLSAETLPKRSVGYLCDRKGKRPCKYCGGRKGAMVKLFGGVCTSPCITTTGFSGGATPPPGGHLSREQDHPLGGDHGLPSRDGADQRWKRRHGQYLPAILSIRWYKPRTLGHAPSGPTDSLKQSLCPNGLVEFRVHRIFAKVQEHIVIKVRVPSISWPRRIMGGKGTRVPQGTRVTLCKAATQRAGGGAAH